MPWPGWVAAFLFFRLFDIWKPWLIGRADRRGDAAGVMLDDLWAGLFAGMAVVIAAGIAAWGADVTRAERLLAVARAKGATDRHGGKLHGRDDRGGADGCGRVVGRVRPGIRHLFQRGQGADAGCAANNAGGSGCGSRGGRARDGRGGAGAVRRHARRQRDGIAGPGGSEVKPEGRVCFGLAAVGRATVVETVEFGARGRDRVRRATVDHALDLLIGALG